MPLLIVGFFVTSSKLDKRYATLQARISDFNDVMESCFSSVRVVKAYVQEAAQEFKFDKSARKRRLAEIDSIKITTIVDSFYNYVWQFGIIIVLVAGGIMLIDGRLTHGNLAQSYVRRGRAIVQFKHAPVTPGGFVQVALLQ